MELRNICKIYHNKNNDVQALKDRNIHIPEKGMTFILGPSGSGKTTLFNMIAGYEPFEKRNREVLDISLACIYKAMN